MGNLFKRNDKKAQEQEPVNQPEGIELDEQELEQMSGGFRDSPGGQPSNHYLHMKHLQHMQHRRHILKGGHKNQFR
ncbi:MAG: hypothetical protein J2P37_27455 [Ktedonobacteraceae bacterium]|nr:hypothetical protein [Ktedonobacteraceae bacterium]MBO0795601.1 hypothetical protein [Ktedonobacteraceae bacterium]